MHGGRACSLRRAGLSVASELDHVGQGWEFAQLEILIARNVVSRSYRREHLCLFDGVDAEVGGLADAINTMLDRIQQAFTARWRSEQKVRQFAADASHELRTPLTTIRGYAELYGQGALDPDQLTTAMRRIDEESQRMSRLVAELLELARLDRGSSLSLTRTDLALLVRDAAADAAAVEPDRPISVQAPEELAVVADEPRIRQVLANLLANVREHTPPGTPGRAPAVPGGEAAPSSRWPTPVPA